MLRTRLKFPTVSRPVRGKLNISNINDGAEFVEAMRAAFTSERLKPTILLVDEVVIVIPRNQQRRRCWKSKAG